MHAASAGVWSADAWPVPGRSAREHAVVGWLAGAQVRLNATVRVVLLLLGGAALAFDPALRVPALVLLCCAGMLLFVRHGLPEQVRGLVVFEAVVCPGLLVLALLGPDEALTVTVLAESSAGGLLIGSALASQGGQRRLAVVGVAAMTAMLGFLAGLVTASLGQEGAAAAVVTTAAFASMVVLGAVTARSARSAGLQLAGHLDGLTGQVTSLAGSVENMSEHLDAARRLQDHAERLVHDNLLPLYQRAASGRLDGADRERFAWLYVEGRHVLRAGTEVEGLTDALDRIDVRATQLGLLLEIIEAVEEPPDDEVLGVLVDVVGTLLGNVAAHAGVPGVHLALRGGRSHLRVTLTDAGRGFDVAAVRWNPSTSKLVVGSWQRLGGTATVESFPGVGTRWTLDLPPDREPPDQHRPMGP